MIVSRQPCKQAVRHADEPAVEPPTRDLTREMRLWRAVIFQAFADATVTVPPVDPIRKVKRRNVYDNSRAELIREQQRAREYLTRRSPDLVEVCEAAGLEADMVIAGAERLAASGWRAPRVR